MWQGTHATGSGFGYFVGCADAVRVLGFGFWEQGTPEVVVLLDRAGDREEVFEQFSLWVFSWECGVV